MYFAIDTSFGFPKVDSGQAFKGAVLHGLQELPTHQIRADLQGPSAEALAKDGECLSQPCRELYGERMDFIFKR